MKDFKFESMKLLEKHRKEGNIAKDKIGMERMGPRLVPQVPPDIYSLPGKELSAGIRPQGKEQASIAFILDSKR